MRKETLQETAGGRHSEAAREGKSEKNTELAKQQDILKDTRRIRAMFTHTNLSNFKCITKLTQSYWRYFWRYTNLNKMIL